MLVSRLHNTLILPLLGTLILIPTTHARETEYIDGISLDGVESKLALDRTPALYTGDFGDCLGGESLFNITKFDAAFYYDNSTILLHLDGSTNIRREDLIFYISVEAYGESRFSMTVDPCKVNIYSMCPLNASQPIEAFALFQIGPQQVSGIPQIAYEIPDLEGFARIQIFANSSQTEIGCFQAVMKNGHTFSQPEAISTVLGVFTVVAIIASFATAAYGVSIPHMRTHYGHSISVLVIFECFQSIFYSGALSLHWPSVLPAWWSNFAWSAGLVPVRHLVRSFDPFVGISGNASQVGAAGSTVINNNGGLSQQIYGRSLVEDFADGFMKRAPKLFDGAANVLKKRQPYDPDNPYDYNWNGDPVKPGMPLPGDWTGFEGNLSALAIPAPNAFMVGLIWLLIVLGLLILLLVAFKCSLEGLSKMKWIKQDRLYYFRAHWAGYLTLAVLRAMFIAFFSMTTLAMYQFAIRGNAGPTAIAATVFAMFVVVVGGLVFYALHSRLRPSKFTSDPDRILLQRGKIMGCIPCLLPVRLSQLGEQEQAQKPAGSLPFVHWHFVDNDSTRENVHRDEPYVKRFGWLSARYRLSKWWFFALWLAYQLIRACFLGGASGNPLVQVFGLFIVDILALFLIAVLSPFEGQRNTALAVWLLGITKVATTGLSIAFLPDFGLNRILTTVIGVVIIIIQSLLTIAVMILIVLGGISSWMSLYRNREYFSSERLEGVRIRYYEHIEQKATDRPPPPTARSDPETAEGFPELPIVPYFSVASVRRLPRIDDEDEDRIEQMNPANVPGGTTITPSPMRRASRTNSVSSRHSVNSLPRGARAVHRASWSSKDFAQWQTEMDRPSPALVRRLSGHRTTNSTSNFAALHEHPSVSSLRTSGTPIAGSRPVTPAKKDAEEKPDFEESIEAERGNDDDEREKEKEISEAAT